MHPILFRIPVPNWNIPGLGPLHELFKNGYIPIYSYGVMLGLSLVVGWYLTLWLAEKDGLPKETMANCYVVTAISALIGARLMYVITNPDEFHSLRQMLAFRHGGLVAYGGFLGGYLGSWAFLKSKKIPLMPWADVAVPSLASGLGITRIGCYLFGCDFGKPLSHDAPGWLKNIGTFPHWAPGTMPEGDGPPAWAQHVQLGRISHDAAASLPVHPTQIYESLVGWTLLGLLLWQRKHQKFRGQVFMLFAFAYGFARFCLEIVRDDAERGFFGPPMAEHVLIPGSLAIFAIAYIFSFSKEISNEQLRRVTQVLSFVPALVAYLTLKPAAYATPEVVQLSTSQIVGLATAVAVAVAFSIFWKAAEAHPAEAMALHLEQFYAAQQGEDEESDKPKKKRRKNKSSKRRKKKEHKGEVVEAAFEDGGKSDDEQDDEQDETDKSHAGEVVDAAFDDEDSEEADQDDQEEPKSKNHAGEVVDAAFDDDEQGGGGDDETKDDADKSDHDDEDDGKREEASSESHAGEVVDAAFDDDGESTTEADDEADGKDDDEEKAPDVVDAAFDDDEKDEKGVEKSESKEGDHDEK